MELVEQIEGQWCQCTRSMFGCNEWSCWTLLLSAKHRYAIFSISFPSLPYSYLWIPFSPSWPAQPCSTVINATHLINGYKITTTNNASFAPTLLYFSLIFICFLFHYWLKMITNLFHFIGLRYNLEYNFFFETRIPFIY